MTDAPTAPGLKATIRVISGPADWAAVEPRWLQFVDHPDTDVGVWCDPRMIRNDVRAKGEQAVLLVEVEDQGGRLIAMLPFAFGQTRVPLRLGLARLGNVPAKTARLYDCMFPRAADQDRAAIVRVVAAELKRQKVCDLLITPEWLLPADGSIPFPMATLRHLQRSYNLRLVESFDAYLAAMKRDTRQKLKAQVRKMEKAFDGKLRVVCYRAPGEVEEFHRLAVAVWQNSWHSRMSAYAPPPVEFLRGIAEQGWLRSYVLMAGDKPAAQALAYQYRDVFTYEATAYDEAFADHGAGTVMSMLFIEDLYRTTPPKMADFGFGYNKYKEILCNEPGQQAEFWWPITLRGSLLTQLVRTLDGIFTRGKDILQRTKVVERIKRRFRGGQGGKSEPAPAAASTADGKGASPDQGAGKNKGAGQDQRQGKNKGAGQDQGAGKNKGKDRDKDRRGGNPQAGQAKADNADGAPAAPAPTDAGGSQPGSAAKSEPLPS